VLRGARHCLRCGWARTPRSDFPHFPDARVDGEPTSSDYAHLLDVCVFGIEHEVELVHCQELERLLHCQANALRMRFESYGGLCAPEGAADRLGAFAPGKAAEDFHIGGGPGTAFRHEESLEVDGQCILTESTTCNAKGVFLTGAGYPRAQC